MKSSTRIAIGTLATYQLLLLDGWRWIGTHLGTVAFCATPFVVITFTLWNVDEPKKKYSPNHPAVRYQLEKRK